MRQERLCYGAAAALFLLSAAIAFGRHDLAGGAVWAAISVVFLTLALPRARK